MRALTAAEGTAILAAHEAAKAQRAVDMPDDAAALRVMMQAWLRLTELGWSEAMYCPKDGTHFDAISAGSTGVHETWYDGEWPDGRWWCFDGSDIWPASPILFRLTL